MFQQFQQLQDDIAELRGIVEEQSHQIAKLQAVVGELARRGDPALAVVAFDQFVEPIYTGKASGFGAASAAHGRDEAPVGQDGVVQSVARIGTSAEQFARGRVAEQRESGSHRICNMW